jgi:hypothetical protein
MEPNIKHGLWSSRGRPESASSHLTLLFCRAWLESRGLQSSGPEKWVVPWRCHCGGQDIPSNRLLRDRQALRSAVHLAWLVRLALGR